MVTLAFLLSILSLALSLILGFLFFKFYNYYTKASTKGKKQSLIQILDTVLKKDEELEKEVEKLNKYCLFLEERLSFTIQKVGLLRFNPFKDTGGDQSFILALVDEHNTGVIISGLHTRSCTRWYAKKIEEGKGVEHELSRDEVKALKNAASLDGSHVKSVEKK